jgi:hypothetical protein
VVRNDIQDIEPDLEIAQPRHYEIFNNDTGSVAVSFLAADDNAAMQRLEQYRSTHTDAHYRVRRAALAGSTQDLAQRRAQGGEFTGAWRVTVDGEEVHRFSGIDNNQMDANRIIGRAWARDQINQGLLYPSGDIEVTPIMS